MAGFVAIVDFAVMVASVTTAGSAITTMVLGTTTVIASGGTVGSTAAKHHTFSQEGPVSASWRGCLLWSSGLTSPSQMRRPGSSDVNFGGSGSSPAGRRALITTAQHPKAAGRRQAGRGQQRKCCGDFADQFCSTARRPTGGCFEDAKLPGPVHLADSNGAPCSQIAGYSPSLRTGFDLLASYTVEAQHGEKAIRHPRG